MPFFIQFSSEIQNPENQFSGYNQSVTIILYLWWKHLLAAMRVVMKCGQALGRGRMMETGKDEVIHLSVVLYI